MSSLVHTVVSEVIASQRLQDQQEQQQQRLICNPPVYNDNLDPNNNSGGNFTMDENKQKSDDIEKPSRRNSEKYSLRPRSSQKRTESDDSDFMLTSTSRGGSRRGASSGCGSSARAKQKPPPLSKYRRKTANARERDRMREINAAFETLRRAVPHIASPNHQNHPDNNGSEKLTKITTLRLAMKYISALSQALQQPETLIQMSENRAPMQPHMNFISCGGGSLQLMSDGESLTFSEHCLTPPDIRQQSQTPPDFTRQCLTPANMTRLSSPDHCRSRDTPPLENKRQNLCTPDLTRHCLSSSRLPPISIPKNLMTSSQNILSSELNIRSHPMTTATDNLCQNHLSADLNRQCLLSSGVNQECSPLVINSNSAQLCLPSPVLSRTCLPPPDLSQHCLTPADFEEHPTEDHSLLVFDDDSLDSPDLDHLLIS